MTDLTAQMSNYRGWWFLYVVLYGASHWPEHNWGKGAAIPTPAERAAALDALGYEVPDDAEWTWIEDSEVPGDPSSPVRLSARITVRAKETP
ncbi:DUF6303 family protein [Streptomyces sp. NPDC093097]|uniref:DUF6303 family protein n=1 Tax=Streptomyces sp. NPDC093097 TaxID=3366027 RepID=UPI0038034004